MTNEPARATTPARRPSRRALLGGAVVVVAAGGAVGLSEGLGGSGRPLTVARWAATRGPRYFIGHRGSGDVRPEHTMEAYEAAYKWGAKALEISTSSTSDGVLICMHDLTYDRTTNLTGEIHDQPSSILRNAGVRQPQLGPAWTTSRLPKIPLLEEAVKRFGGRMILCIEPKRDDDYDAVVALIEKHELRDSVIIKLFHTSSKIAVAKSAGYPVFAYLGGNDVSAESIKAIAERLDRRDYLVIPTRRRPDEEYLPRNLVSAAVNTRIPVWVYPVHRRSEADRYTALGVTGIISSSIGYGRRAVRRINSDTWASGAIASGEMTRDPADPSYRLRWSTGGVLTLAAAESQHFVTLGQFSPLPGAGARYRIEFDARWAMLPSDPEGGLSVVFGHADDRYYEQGLGTTGGYHANLGLNGALTLHRHEAGSPAAAPLGSSRSTPAAERGRWMRLRVDVTASTVAWSRLDGASPARVTAVDSHFRGGYFHLGRLGPDGAVSFRSLRIT